jgi:oligopeptidase B
LFTDREHGKVFPPAIKTITPNCLLMSSPMLALLLLAGAAAAEPSASSLPVPRIDLAAARPPIARRIPTTRMIHDDRRIDDYDWLRDKTDPEVLRYLRAENDYTAAVMRPTQELQQELYREMVARIPEADATVPYYKRGYWYYLRTEAGRQYPIQCRKPGSLDAAEQVVLDLNRLAEGRPFLKVHEQAISDDGRLLAFTTDVSGFRDFTLQFKDLQTGADLPDRALKVRSLAWAADTATLFYVADDAAKRPYRLYRHTVGGGPDTLVYEEKDEFFRIYIRRSADGRFILITSQSLTTTEMRTVPSDRPAEPPRLLLPREDHHEYDAEHRAGWFYVRTNKDAPEFRLVRFPAGDPRPGSWQDVVPSRAGVAIEDFKLFASFAVVFEREGGLPALRVVNLDAGRDHRIALPERVCTVLAENNPEFSSTHYRFRYTSPVTPESLFEYDMTARTLELRKRARILGGFDPGHYRVEWTHATAPDGAHVPISLVAGKEVPRDGTAPLLLYGYGAYGAAMDATFDAKQLSLLDRGLIYAVAHVRGGGDLGEAWQDQGRATRKQNAVTDFIAVAEHLIRQRYTAADRLAIEGISAGGVLIGAALNQRPDLFRAAVLQGPFLDVVNSMLDPTLPLTVPEYLEWGDPRIRNQYEAMKAYCPYTNISAQAYPALLLQTTLDDSQVMFWEPVKFAAKLRACKTDSNPLLLKIDSGRGHTGPSGRYDVLRAKAFVYAFLLSQIRAAR